MKTINSLTSRRQLSRGYNRHGLYQLYDIILNYPFFLISKKNTFVSPRDRQQEPFLAGSPNHEKLIFFSNSRGCRPQIL